MILVDTSVWIDNLRAPNRELRERVEAREVLCHAMVVGELACGLLPERDRFLEQLNGFPSLKTLSADDLLALIERNAWMGRGIGYVDANLLGAVLADGNVDVFDPSAGEVRSDGPDGIACWFVDTDYNEESFFVRQAYFLGAGDPWKSLRTTLKAEIDPDAWATLHSDTSRPFPKPATGRIAVKVINHLGDEVMKVFGV